MTKTVKKHTLYSKAYLYRPYRGEAPPPFPKGETIYNRGGTLESYKQILA